MKPGQLVMLISHGGYTPTNHTPKLGSVGEVIDSSKYLNEVKLSEVAVHFPNNPSESRTGYWTVPTSWLIPINDPDIDLSEETEESLNEELVLVD